MRIYYLSGLLKYWIVLLCSIICIRKTFLPIDEKFYFLIDFADRSLQINSRGSKIYLRIYTQVSECPCQQLLGVGLFNSTEISIFSSCNTKSTAFMQDVKYSCQSAQPKLSRKVGSSKRHLLELSWPI